MFRSRLIPFPAAIFALTLLASFLFAAQHRLQQSALPGQSGQGCYASCSGPGAACPCDGWSCTGSVVGGISTYTCAQTCNNNGVCNSGETSQNCPADCGGAQCEVTCGGPGAACPCAGWTCVESGGAYGCVQQACGNNQCDNGEDYTTCPADCSCGDNVCDGMEQAGECQCIDDCEYPGAQCEGIDAGNPPPCAQAGATCGGGTVCCNAANVQDPAKLYCAKEVLKLGPQDPQVCQTCIAEGGSAYANGVPCCAGTVFAQNVVQDTPGVVFGTCRDPNVECGNGDREGEEDCDDGNTEDGDGCSALCTGEKYYCLAGSTFAKLCTNSKVCTWEGNDGCDIMAYPPEYDAWGVHFFNDDDTAYDSQSECEDLCGLTNVSGGTWVAPGDGGITGPAGTTGTTGTFGVTGTTGTFGNTNMNGSGDGGQADGGQIAQNNSPEESNTPPPPASLGMSQASSPKSSAKPSSGASSLSSKKSSSVFSAWGSITQTHYSWSSKMSHASSAASSAVYSDSNHFICDPSVAYCCNGVACVTANSCTVLPDDCPGGIYDSAAACDVSCDAISQRKIGSQSSVGGSLGSAQGSQTSGNGESQASGGISTGSQRSGGSQGSILPGSLGSRGSVRSGSQGSQGSVPPGSSASVRLSGSSVSRCSFNDQCSSGMCVGGVCIPRSASSVVSLPRSSAASSVRHCAVNAQCPGGSCVNGICQPGSSSARSQSSMPQCRGDECARGGTLACGQLGTMTCAATAQLPCIVCVAGPSSRSFVRSSIGSCTTNAQCPGGMCLNGTCTAGSSSSACANDLQCPAGNMCMNGSCVQKASSSVSSVQSCWNDFQCPFGQCVNGTCTSSSAPSCTDNVQCATGLCIDGRCESCDADNRCPIGQCVAGVCPQCLSHEQCDSGLCIQQKCVDVMCTDNAQCATGLCIDGDCSPCLFNAQCVSNLCERGICAPLQPAGQTLPAQIVDITPQCTDGSQCTSGVCIDGRCGPCGSDRDCRAGFRCTEGFCTQEGRCASDAQCGAGERCLNGQCAARVASVECISDAQCPAGKICSQNRCTVSPSSAPQTTQSGPGAIAMMAAGAAAGYAWIRRRRG